MEPRALPDHEEQISSMSQILAQRPLNIIGTVFHGRGSKAATQTVANVSPAMWASCHTDGSTCGRERRGPSRGTQEDGKEPKGLRSPTTFSLRRPSSVSRPLRPDLERLAIPGTHRPAHGHRAPHDGPGSRRGGWPRPSGNTARGWGSASHITRPAPTCKRV